MNFSFQSCRSYGDYRSRVKLWKRVAGIEQRRNLLMIRSSKNMSNELPM